jgi:hypothetical protein
MDVKNEFLHGDINEYIYGSKKRICSGCIISL